MSTTPQSTAAAKTQLRASIETIRSALPADVRAIRAREIALVAAGWVADLAQPDTIVSGFLSIGSEIETMPTLERLAAAGYRLALPVMVAPRVPLVFRAWMPGEPLTAVKWGIREPLATAPEVIPRILLVPLLAFDASGGRLGYGGGFYDRTMRKLRAGAATTAAGFAFDEQAVDAVPSSDYDEPLDWVLTPSRAIRCQT